MYQADLAHPSPRLQDKLTQLYALRADKNVELGFRPEFLDLLKAFGNPHLTLPPVIHVAGTNGKGSIVAILRAILEAAGKKVHVFTSPHLVRFNERIVLAGRTIGNDALEDLIDEALELNRGRAVSFFEITTAMAFAAFARVQADVTLVEVGLGGRLDCTNIIPKPAVSVINKISYDHTDYLGSTLAEIAKEKAGIMKYETPCVIGYQTPAFLAEGALDVFVDGAADKNAPLYCAGRHWFSEPVTAPDDMTFQFEDLSLTLPRPSLTGDHQIANAGAALAALRLYDPNIMKDKQALAEGLRRVRWPGRMERIAAGPLHALLPPGWDLWFDGGHNDTGADTIRDQLILWQTREKKPVHLIIAQKGDKDVRRFLEPLLPLGETLTLTDLHGVGSFVGREQYAEIMRAHYPDQPYIHFPDLKQAIQNLARRYGDGEPARILICGSLYLGRQIYDEI